MRGAGCTLNDILDRDIDAQVERTRTRPLPSGDVSPGGAVLFLGAQLLAGLLVLAQFSYETMAIGAASLLLVTPYPLMKRVTWWPQLFLGLAFNWGALLGYVALTGTLDWPAVWLYLGGIAWTIGYDTIYAFQDRTDDELVGIKSTARLFGERGRPLVGLFYGLALACWSVAFWLAAGSVVAVLLMVAAVGGQFAWQLRRWRPDDPANCLRLFKSNGWVGWLMLAACVLAAMLTWAASSSPTSPPFDNFD
jgi:4-hydroxybenzoate polyprenyltransferase